MADEPMLLFLATYDAEADARLDYAAGRSSTPSA